MLQNDPEKREALRQGLLAAGSQMMAGGRQDLGTSIGQGLGSGVNTYASQREVYKQEAERARQRQAQQSAINAAMIPGRPAMPQKFNVGGNPYATRDAAQAAAMPNQNTQLMAGAMGSQAQPEAIEEVPGQTAQPGGFDAERYYTEVLMNPDNPERDTALRYFASKKPADAEKPQLVTVYENGQPVQKWLRPGEAEGVSVGAGKPEAGATPYGQDLREFLAVNGVDPAKATPQQLQAAYTYVNQVKDNRAPRTTVTVGPTRVENITTQESEGSKVYGKGLGEMQVDIQKQGFTAPTRIANLDRMSQLLEGVDSGRLSGAGLEAARFAKSFGLDVDPKLGNKQAAEALAIEMALAMREPGSGPMTDKDFNNYMNTVPSLAKSAEGRREITATLKAKARRDLEIAKMTREYAKKNRGVIDDNFLDQVAEYMAANPVVPIARDYGGGWKIEKAK